MSIQRYYPILVKNNDSASVRMAAHSNGTHVTYESHAEELRRVQSELDALKEGLKRQIFAPLEKAMMNALIKTAMAASETVYTVNPCNKLTAERVREVVESNIESGAISIAEGETFIRDAIISESLVKVGSITLGGGVMTMSQPEQKENSDAWSLLCVKSNCKYFTAGKRYDYEIRADEMVIVQDDYVSDLAYGDDYELTDEGAYWMMTDSHSQGESVAIFKKNK